MLRNLTIFLILKVRTSIFIFQWNNNERNFRFWDQWAFYFFIHDFVHFCEKVGSIIYNLSALGIVSVCMLHGDSTLLEFCVHFRWRWIVWNNSFLQNHRLLYFILAFSIHGIIIKYCDSFWTDRRHCSIFDLF